jgi:hypothetical protein
VSELGECVLLHDEACRRTAFEIIVHLLKFAPQASAVLAAVFESALATSQ